MKGDACDEKIDLWALGCVLYVLLSGDSPFYGPDCQNRILEGRLDPMEGDHWDQISLDAKQLITDLLQVQPSNRLSAHAVLDHPWLQKTAPHQKLEATALKHISALETFHNQNFLRHLAAGVLAKQLDESDLHELHRAFCEMDQDENGVVTFSEFKDVLRDSGLMVLYDPYLATFS